MSINCESYVINVINQKHWAKSQIFLDSNKYPISTNSLRYLE